MNINAIKTALSFSDYNKGFPIIAQVYIFDIYYLPKDTQFTFHLPVKSYTPEIFSTYNFNKAERQTINIKNYIVGDTFTLGKNLISDEIKFYLTSDVKVSKSDVLNKFKVVFLGHISTVPIYGRCSAIIIRHLSPTAKIHLDTIASVSTLRAVNPTANLSITIKPTINNNKYISSNTNLSLVGSVKIEPNCEMTYWIRKFDTWRDCDTWSYRKVDTDCKNSNWEHKFSVWRDCNTWS
jgi:hypothetical protein